MTLPTVEIRWFAAGTLPVDIASWFESTSPLSARIEDRTDRYLRPADPATNIKIREGRLEIKRRIWIDTGFEDCPMIAGTIEAWNKCGFDIDTSAEAHTDANWISCRKRRATKWFSWGFGGLVPLSGPESAASACQLEMSSLTIMQQHWWTVGFEATGTNSRDLLEKTTRSLMAGFPMVEPELLMPMGYAEWLRSCFPDG